MSNQDYFLSLLQPTRFEESSHFFITENLYQSLEYESETQTKLSIKAHILTSTHIIDVENIIQINEEVIENQLENQKPKNIMITQEHNPINEQSPTKKKIPKTIEGSPSTNREKNIKKIPYNFGQIAIGDYMMRLIQNNNYDNFLKNQLKQNNSFIDRFKNFCLKISYKNIGDFKAIWKYKRLIDHDYNDFRVILTKITERFLQKEVLNWFCKARIKDYIPFYKKCVESFLTGIKDVENFEVNDF